MYADPWRGRVRALERNIVKYRAIQVALVIHYTEKLRRTVIGSVQATSKLRKVRRKYKSGERVLVSGDEVIRFKSALNVWVDEGWINRNEAVEIRRLIDFRNDVSHRLHQLNVDISRYRYDQERLYHFPDTVKRHDYKAVDQLKEMIEILDVRVVSHHLGRMVGLEDLSFETSEHILTSELKSLGRKINRLTAKRKKENDQIRRETKAIQTAFLDRLGPKHWPLRHENGRLTETGMALCEDLFTAGYSTLAVAYVMELSLASARLRRRTFLARA